MKAAPLSGLLLARKGDARPAQAPAIDAVAPLVTAAPVAERAGISTIMRPSLTQPAELRPIAQPADLTARLRPGFGGGAGGGETVRISVRMDRDRHRRLRILAAQRGISLQQAMIRAIDGMVASSATQGDGAACACLSDPQARGDRSKR